MWLVLPYKNQLSFILLCVWILFEYGKKYVGCYSIQLPVNFVLFYFSIQIRSHFQSGNQPTIALFQSFTIRQKIYFFNPYGSFVFVSSEFLCEAERSRNLFQQNFIKSP